MAPFVALAIIVTGYCEIRGSVSHPRWTPSLSGEPPGGFGGIGKHLVFCIVCF